MAASAPRKAPPRKAPTKPTPSLEEQASMKRIAVFDELRARAGDSPGLVSRSMAEPYVLGVESGFDPPLIARFPTDLEAKIELEIASRRGDTLGVLNVLLGDAGLLQAIRMFKQVEDGDKLLVGLHLRLADHFLGRGAGDVPGGTPASSQ